MGCRWIYSMPVRTLLLIVGVALITLGIAEGKNILWVVGVISCVASVLVSGNATTITRKELADAGSYSKP